MSAGEEMELGGDDVADAQAVVDADPPAEGSTPRAGTDYVLLQLVEDNDETDPPAYVVVLGKITATGADQAIRAFTDANEVGGTFVAVPTRSFQSRVVVVETTTVMKFA